MKRINYIQTVNIGGGEWRNDATTARYLRLNRKNIASQKYVIPSHMECRLDLIALQLYGDPSYWIILALFNGMIDALRETTTGKEIKIPNKKQIDDLLTDTANKRRTGEVIEV